VNSSPKTTKALLEAMRKNKMDQRGRGRNKILACSCNHKVEEKDKIHPSKMSMEIVSLTMKTKSSCYSLL
jgi:hypothetical protein